MVDNSVPIFHEDVTTFCQPEVRTSPCRSIDDVPIKARIRLPRQARRIRNAPDNPGIRRFVWEHFHNVNRIVQVHEVCRRDFLWFEGSLMRARLNIVGHRCTLRSRLLTRVMPQKLWHWGPATTFGVHAFPWNSWRTPYFHSQLCAPPHALTMLTRRDVPFDSVPSR